MHGEDKHRRAMLRKLEASLSPRHEPRRLYRISRLSSLSLLSWTALLSLPRSAANTTPSTTSCGSVFKSVIRRALLETGNTVEVVLDSALAPLALREQHPYLTILPSVSVRCHPASP